MNFKKQHPYLNTFYSWVIFSKQQHAVLPDEFRTLNLEGLWNSDFNLIKLLLIYLCLAFLPHHSRACLFDIHYYWYSWCCQAYWYLLNDKEIDVYLFHTVHHNQSWAQFISLFSCDIHKVKMSAGCGLDWKLETSDIGNVVLLLW